MSPIKGIKKLPISIPITDATKVLLLLNEVSNKLGRLDERFKYSLLGTELINTLSLNESVQSTRIEGTQVTFIEMIEQAHKKKSTPQINEVENYRKALHHGYEQIRNGYPISTRLILEIHAILMKNSRGTTEGSGEFRKIQNFIGPNNKIEDASYIPIEANEIPDFLNNWENFINKHPYGQPLSTDHIEKENTFIVDENSPSLLKAAVMHAQFESIHPFLDGNGRLGRILIALYTVQSNLISSPIFFVSEELEKQRFKYYHFLNGTRGNNPSWVQWIEFFLEASNRMADKLNLLLENAEKIALDGLKKCEKEIQKRIYLLTFRYPNTNATQVSQALNISPSTARQALNFLVDNQLLYKDGQAKRNVDYYNYDITQLIQN